MNIQHLLFILKNTPCDSVVGIVTPY